MNNQDLYDFLRSIGACLHCCLRHLQGKGSEYLDVKKSLAQKEIKIEDNIHDDDTQKRLKSNPCTICLGLFQETIIEKIVHSLKTHPDLQKYDCPTISAAFSLPIILQLRQLIVWITLLKQFPGKYDQENPPDIPIKDCFRAIVNQKLIEVTGKPIDMGANGILITFEFQFENEHEILSKLTLVNPKYFKDRSQMSKKFKKEFLTRNAFDQNFIPAKINLIRFKEQYQVPPDIPSNPIEMTSVTVKGPIVFVAGRYCKFSRRLSQSPWVLDGRKVMEDSVQQYITEQIYKFFEVPETDITFSASGREDVDVRCLGDGRPFILEIPDAKKAQIPFEVARKMEREVNKCGKISIKDLQVVTRESTALLRCGEEDKKKIYRAMCALKVPVTDEIIKKLTIPDGFTVQQTTPIRVLHRRPLLVRPRKVYCMQASKSTVSDKALILDVTTQAGTYIKELVHSDFGRTIPSCKSLIDNEIDLIALDVMAIDLDWPPKINYDD
uniref:tRNA pseudouridine(55) synthase n=1 Tax=Culicoides sonorensis TaxID=179676 RepID=A0A336MFF3_CULSO